MVGQLSGYLGFPASWQNTIGALTKKKLFIYICRIPNMLIAEIFTTVRQSGRSVLDGSDAESTSDSICPTMTGWDD
jgi:hypothetical protein